MQEISDSTRAVSTHPSDPVLQATAIAGLGAVAVMHFAQVVPTTEETPWLGAAFVLLSFACVGVAAQLLHSATRLVWVQLAALNTLVIAGFAFTRLISTPIDNADVGNWSETLGVAALFIEGLLVVLSLHVLTGRPHFLSSPARSPGTGSARADQVDRANGAGMPNWPILANARSTPSGNRP
jgi:hypothetical protein